MSKAKALIAEFAGDGEFEAQSAGALHLDGAVHATFAKTGAVGFTATGAKLSTSPETVQVFGNGVQIDPSSVSVSPDGAHLSITGALQEGFNRIEVRAQDAGGLQLATEAVIWAGSNNLTVTVQDGSGNAVAGALVTARLTEDQAIVATAFTAANGTAVFQNLPDRNISLESSLGDAFASTVALGGDGTATLALRGFNQPSDVANNDFSHGNNGRLGRRHRAGSDCRASGPERARLRRRRGRAGGAPHRRVGGIARAALPLFSDHRHRPYRRHGPRAVDRRRGGADHQSNL